MVAPPDRRATYEDVLAAPERWTRGAVSSILATQRAINESSRDAWDAYAKHRRRVTELVGGAPGGSLVLLGAGNCNDVDLEALVRMYDAVRLVDVDAESLARARDRQSADVRAKLRLADPIDLGGLDAIVQGAPLPEPRFVAAELVRALGGGASMVGSPCLFSRLVGAAAARVGPGHPRFLEVVRYVRDVGPRRCYLVSAIRFRRG